MWRRDTFLLPGICRALSKTKAVAEAEGVPTMGRKCVIFDSRSMMTRMVVNPPEGSRSTMKSMEISAHGSSGMDNGFSSTQVFVFDPLLH